MAGEYECGREMGVWQYSRQCGKEMGVWQYSRQCGKEMGVWQYSRHALRCACGRGI